MTPMPALHRGLVGAAIVAAALAAWVGEPRPRTAAAALRPGEVSAASVGQWIRGRAAGLRIVDLRSRAEFADGRVQRYDIQAQARAVFANVRAVLEASGARWEDLVDVTVYLTDMLRDFRPYNEVWAEQFPDPATAPCRTTVGITALPTPIAIELKCIAVVKD